MASLVTPSLKLPNLGRWFLTASGIIRDGWEELARQFEYRNCGVSITAGGIPGSAQWSLLVSAPDDADAAYSNPARKTPETASCDLETGQKERPEKSCILLDAVGGNGV